MIESLRALLGPHAVLEDTELDGWHVSGVRPHAVVLPEHVDQVAAVLRQASAARVPVEPAGNGTWLRAGPAPRTAPVVLSLQRLREVVEYVPADLVASLQAGVQLSDFQNLACQQRQFIALDPPGSEQATVGALVATASAGPLRYAFATPRDQVLGLQLVTGDGRVLHLGGKVVKNVAGYDLTRLAIGSRGTLGVITCVHIRLQPLPACDATFELRGSIEQLLPTSAALQHAALEPVAMEVVLSGEQGKAGECEARLLVRVQGNEDALIAAEAELQRTVRQPVVQMTGPDARLAWTRLGDGGAGKEISVRLAALPSMAMRVWSAASRVASTLPAHQIALHAGAGIVRVDGACPVDRDNFVRAVAQARADLAGLQGSVHVSAAPPGWFESLQPPPPEGAKARLMRELKNVFDPAGIMTPRQSI